MSKAARKARKIEQRETGQKYQHPTREGVPYGRSPQPRMTGLDLDYAKDAWPDHSRVGGFAEGRFR